MMIFDCLKFIGIFKPTINHTFTLVASLAVPSIEHVSFRQGFHVV